MQKLLDYFMILSLSVVKKMMTLTKNMKDVKMKDSNNESNEDEIERVEKDSKASKKFR